MNIKTLQSSDTCTTPDRKMRSNTPHHIVTTNALLHPYHMDFQLESLSPSNMSPNTSPGPLLRPISSPMTPITPLVLSESHYEKEFLHYHEDSGYFYHTHHVQQLQRYGYHDQYDHHNHKIFTSNSPLPLSSGASMPIYSNLCSSSKAAIISHRDSSNDRSVYDTAPQYDLAPIATKHVKFDSETAEMVKDIITGNSIEDYYNYDEYQKVFEGESNDMKVISLSNEIMTNNSTQRQDIQFNDMMTGLGNMDIMDSR